MPSVRLQVPESVADAIRGEANRRLMHPGEVLTEFVRTFWPRYVQCQLARDLTPVLDVEEVDRPEEMATPPAEAEGASRLISPDQAEPSLPLPRPEAEACGGDD